MYYHTVLPTVLVCAVVDLVLGQNLNLTYTHGKNCDADLTMECHFSNMFDGTGTRNWKYPTSTDTIILKGVSIDEDKYTEIIPPISASSYFTMTIKGVTKSDATGIYYCYYIFDNTQVTLEYECYGDITSTCINNEPIITVDRVYPDLPDTTLTVTLTDSSGTAISGAVVSEASITYTDHFKLTWTSSDTVAEGTYTYTVAIQTNAAGTPVTIADNLSITCGGGGGGIPVWVIILIVLGILGAILVVVLCCCCPFCKKVRKCCCCPCCEEVRERCCCCSPCCKAVDELCCCCPCCKDVHEWCTTFRHDHCPCCTCCIPITGNNGDDPEGQDRHRSGPRGKTGPGLGKPGPGLGKPGPDLGKPGPDPNKNAVETDSTVSRRDIELQSKERSIDGVAYRPLHGEGKGIEQSRGISANFGNSGTIPDVDTKPRKLPPLRPGVGLVAGTGDGVEGQDSDRSERKKKKKKKKRHSDEDEDV